MKIKRNVTYKMLKYGYGSCPGIKNLANGYYKIICPNEKVIDRR